MSFRLLVIFLFLESFVFSQTPAIKHYLPRPDGLPQMQVKNMYIAPDGALWVCTNGGIGRFNGRKFKNYQVRDGLSSNITTDVFIYDDTTWVATRDGLDYIVHDTARNFYHTNREKFYGAKLYRYDNLFYLYNISEIRNDNNNRSMLFDIRKKQFHNQVKIGDSLPFEYCSLPLKDSILVVVENHLVWASLRSFQGRIFSTFKDDKILGFETYTLCPILSLGDSTRFLQSRSKVIQYETSRTPFKKLAYHKNNIKFDIANQFFSAKFGELLGFNSESEIWLVDTNRVKKLFTLGAIIHRVQYHDPAYWIGSDNGLWKIGNAGFEYYQPEDGFPTNVWSVIPGKTDKLWFATFTKGIQRYSGSNIMSSYYFFAVMYYNGALSGFNTDLLFPNNRGVTIVDTISNSYQEISLSQPVLTLSRDERNKIILAGSMNSLVAIDTNYQSQVLLDIPTLGVNYTILAIEPRVGNYLLGLGRGLAEYNYQTGQGRLLMRSNVRVSDLITDSTGTIWAGTSLGLMKLVGDSLEPVFPDFVSEDVLTLEISNDNRLFIVSTNSLYTLDLNRYHSGQPQCMLAYNESAGYNTGEPGQNALYKDEQGIFWLPTTDNVVKIDPKLIAVPRHLPVAVFVKGNASNSKLTVNHSILLNNKKIVLPWQVNNLHLEYEAVELDFPESLRFQYKLEPGMIDWRKLNDETDLNLNNLRPGNYALYVRATISESFDGAPESKLLFSIAPPFWFTWWFIGICILIAFLIIWFIVLYFIRRERKKALHHAEILRLKSLAMGIQIDNHFLVNCIAKIALLNQEGKTEAATDYSNNFIRFLQSNLHSLRSELVTLADELEMIKSYAKIEQLGSVHFDLNIKIDTDIEPDKITIPPFLVQPLVENSIRHGIKKLKNLHGLIEIRVSRKKSGCLLIGVTDNGIGLSHEESAGNHIGMKIIKERLMLIGKESEIIITPLEPGFMVELIICIH